MVFELRARFKPYRDKNLDGEVGRSSKAKTSRSYAGHAHGRMPQKQDKEGS